MNSNENTNTEVATTAPAPELDLFKYSAPKLDGTLVITPRKDEAGKVLGISMTLPKKKDIASKLGVTSKDGAVTAQMRKASDMLLTIGLAEFQAGMRDNQITGARFAKSKSGRLTLSAVPIEKRIVSQEQLQAAFIAMTPAERKAFLAGIKGVPAQKGNVVTLEAETGNKVKKGKRVATPAKAAAKTPEQPPVEAQAEVADNPPVEETVPAIDNQATTLPEAPAN